MKTPLAITDLTRMQRGCVCVAGYDKDGRCVRPVLPPPGILESSLYAGERPAIFPFAVVEYDLLQPIVEPPHTEDWRYDPASVRFLRPVAPEKWRGVLEMGLFGEVAAIFEQPVLTDPGFYVMAGQGPRSLGTVRPQLVFSATYRPKADRWDYRLRFVGGAGVVYNLQVTDLAWRYLCDQRREAGEEPDRIAADLTAALKSAEVYLRIGLARGWEKYPDRCYLQITGVQAFPDYLHGKTFADLSPGTR
ncbi:MAG: hypothetical protein HY784_00620 [Chloroflexi bacterium]|nr:hypothetical protein [Chloroflexota bacterium]